MNLISLLIALSAQKKLSSPVWQFSFYVDHFFTLCQRFGLLSKEHKQIENTTVWLLILIPVVITYFLMTLINDTLLYLVVSTLVLIVSFGCVRTRDTYKCFLQAANRDEPTTCELILEQLQQDKNLPELPFGESMVWLNYRYYIAPMLIFVILGPVAALLYRLMLTFIELSPSQEDENFYASSEAKQDLAKFFAIIDWPLVRVVSFAYMLVGHFSKAMPTWLESFFDFDLPPHLLLTNVAKQAEDFMVEEGDCVAEPCLLVKLAKRTLLLMLSVVAVLTITGVIS